MTDRVGKSLRRAFSFRRRFTNKANAPGHSGRQVNQNQVNQNQLKQHYKSAKIRRASMEATANRAPSKLSRL